MTDGVFIFEKKLFRKFCNVRMLRKISVPTPVAPLKEQAGPSLLSEFFVPPVDRRIRCTHLSRDMGNQGVQLREPSAF